MPFFMVYGLEVILPTNHDYVSPQVMAYDEEGNQASLKDVIDQLKEAQDIALLRVAK